MENLSNFAERLSELMGEVPIKSDALGKIIGVSGSAIRRWKRNAGEITMFYLVKLADYFICSTDYLVGLENENKSNEFNITPKFSVRLKAIFEEFKTNPNKLSKQSGVSRSSIYEWLNEEKFITLESLQKLVKSLDCTIDYLIGREK